MIFVMLGTQNNPFQRLLEEIDNNMEIELSKLKEEFKNKLNINNYFSFQICILCRFYCMICIFTFFAIIL